MTRNDSAYQIVQLTDCHLFADPEVELRGIHTWPRFLAAIEDVQQRFPDADLLAITGDTAHDEQRATYEAVRQALGPWCDRLRIIPGNHDHRNALLEAFPAGCQAVGDRVTFEVRPNDWQIIGLDSHLPGEVAGSLLSDQLAWLDERLTSHPELPTLLLVHHPPIEVGSPWLDRLRLQDAEGFTSLLTRHSHVRLVGCGHVHQEVTSRLGNATVFTTPAVGPPFRPRTAELEIDCRPPSYRVIELSADGNWRIQVIAVPIVTGSQEGG
jgi:3',5'-cyclic-AMP phosphodiesterase